MPEEVDLKEFLPLTQTIFEQDGRTYCYEFDNLTCEQVEYANEVLDWKRMQRTKGAANFSEITRSGGGEWLTLVLGFILVPYSNDRAQPFDLAAIAHTRTFVKSLKVAHRTKLMECVQDFFTRIGRQQDYTTCLLPNAKLSASEILSESLAKMMMQTPSTDE